MGLFISNTSEKTQKKCHNCSGCLAGSGRGVCMIIEKGTHSASSMMLPASKIVFLSNLIGEGKCPCPSLQRRCIAGLEQ